MSKTIPYPPYLELSESLYEGGSFMVPAELHGFICGLLCSNGKLTSDWYFQILEEQAPQHAIDLVKQVYDITADQLAEFALEFSLLLPPDDADINTRAEALGLWCEGFLIGLSQFIDLKNLPPNEQIQESLNELTEIAQIDFRDIEADNEDETAFFELVEHVRLTALMLFQELKNLSTEETANLDENKLQ